MAENAPVIPIRRLGAYELQGIVGHGGTGAVYKGRDVRSGQVVAIKVASQAVAQNELASKRFAAEYKLAQTLNHPHLIPVLDQGTENQVPYLVMEFMEGSSLAMRLKKVGRFDEAAALTIILQIADALAYLHEHQIIHRDVKPANILFDSQGQARLADLGLSKDLESPSALTHSRAGLGTVQFAAPEQFDDARGVDARCDVYSLAATLYNALTGDVPYGTRSPIGVLQRKMRDQFDAPISKLPLLHPRVDAVIRLALNADRDKRPTSIREFVAYLTGERVIPEGASLSGIMPIPSLNRKTGRSFSKERRVSIRYATDLESTCRNIAGSNQQRWPVMIKDVSHTGVCLRVKRRFEVGNLLDVLFVLDENGSATSQLVRVCRVQEFDQNIWQIGCEFIHAIDQNDLDAFLHDRMQATDMT